MRALGCDRRVISADEAVRIEPALRHVRSQLAGATNTAEGESGDANAFARGLVAHCQADGVTFLLSHTITALRQVGGRIDYVEATDAEGRLQRVRGDAYVLAMGSLSPIYAAPLGIHLPVYPAKGYSVTLPVKDEAMAHQVSLTDDEYKLVFSRLGAKLHRRHRRAQRLRPGPEPGALRGHRATDGGAVPGRGRHRAGAVLDRPAAGNAVERADHRQVEGREALPEHGSRVGWTHSCGSGKSIARIVSGLALEIDFVFVLAPAPRFAAKCAAVGPATAVH